jgi:hypothetical protein
LSYRTEKFYKEQIAKNNYNVNDLTEIKIPVNMPNIAEWTEYENVSGSIRFEDNSYNYVKMKITHNFMYLMCVPNYETTHLSGDNVLTAKHIKDIPVPKKDHLPFGKTNALEKFQFNFLQFAFNIPAKSIKIFTIGPVQKVSSNCLDIPEQPPRPFCLIQLS